MAGSKSKITGTILELEFAAECIKRGGIVSQPIGETHYDFLVDNGARIFRVQVKAASPKSDGRSYYVNLNRKVPNPNKLGGSSLAVAYKKGELDCIVTRAGREWFFFDNPELLLSTESVYPDSDVDHYKGNRGHSKWDLIGLSTESEASDVNAENILIEITTSKEND